MPTLNADIPQFDCFVRKEFLYDLREHRGEFEPVTAFGVASLYGRALGFHVMTRTGACIWRLPIHALAHKTDAPPIALDAAQLWDCFGYDLSVTEFSHLCGRRCMCLLKDKSRNEGRYLFTVDWYGNAASENAGDGGHKCAHVIELDNGCYCALPNNRILWADPAYITEPFKRIPDYKTNTHVWSCENTTRWATSDDDRMFYDVTPSIQT